MIARGRKPEIRIAQKPHARHASRMSLRRISILAHVACPDPFHFLGHRFVCMLARFAIAALAWAGLVQPSPADVHAWKSIQYPPLPIPGLETEKLTVLVGSGGGDEASHLRFDVLWSARRDASLPAEIADVNKLVVRLHLSDGKAIAPETGRHPPSWIGAGSRGITYSITYVFPWQKNVMEEAWIEFVMPGQTYWIELPYGFTRNPADAFASDAKRGEPAFPSSMNALGEKDRLVPWLHVNYDLGKIQNNWRLSLKLANPFDAQAEVILYRDDMRVGKSMFLWKLDTPRTAMEIRTSDGSVLTAHGMGIHLHEDGLRRSDSYSFNRYPEEGRDWGKVVIKVDDKSYECLVPSSLFKYVHGVTDRGNARRLPRPEQAH
jgi:hypothetical protein